jgi:glycerophosphoryl diester phosphodiesterase
MEGFSAAGFTMSSGLEMQLLPQLARPSPAAGRQSADLQSRILLLGHRGHRLSRTARLYDQPDTGALQERENSIAAFERALRCGCDGLELDLHLSGDGQLVVHHDETVGPLAIANRTLKALRCIEPELTTLPAVLRRFRRRAWLDLEVKGRGAESELVECLRRFPPVRGFVISSFHPAVLKRLHQLDPALPLCINLQRPRTVRWLRYLPIAWVAPHARFATRWYLKRLHAAGWNTLVWTVNRPHRMRGIARAGGNAIVSDDPGMLVSTLGYGEGHAG